MLKQPISALCGSHDCNISSHFKAYGATDMFRSQIMTVSIRNASNDLPSISGMRRAMCTLRLRRTSYFELPRSPCALITIAPMRFFCRQSLSGLHAALEHGLSSHMHEGKFPPFGPLKGAFLALTPSFNGRRSR